MSIGLTEVFRYLIDTSKSNRAYIQTLLTALELDSRDTLTLDAKAFLDMTKPTGPGVPGDPANERKKAKKPKAKKEPIDPVKVLANNTGGRGYPDAPAPYKATTGLWSRIKDVLHQSTGPLSPVEIGELIDVPPGRVSASLCHQFLREKYKGLKRVAGTNDGRAVYLYTLTEGK